MLRDLHNQARRWFTISSGDVSLPKVTWRRYPENHIWQLENIEHITHHISRNNSTQATYNHNKLLLLRR